MRPHKSEERIGLFRESSKRHNTKPQPSRVDHAFYRVKIKLLLN